MAGGTQDVATAGYGGFGSTRRKWAAGRFRRGGSIGIDLRRGALALPERRVWRRVTAS